ncbi:MAG: OmpA family protein, partial [Spirochaetes bacterium]|nr:OmpA family protein [Spirochaetota bacterium]
DPTLTEEARETLRELIASVQRLAGEERRVEELQLVGHCALAGTEAGRVELSQARAGNVWRFLRRNGIDEPDELVVRGVGGRDPVTLSDEEQYLNRRVEITVQIEPRS